MLDPNNGTNIPLLEVTPLALKHTKACQSLDQLAMEGIWTKEHWQNELKNPRHICLGIWHVQKLLALVCSQLIVDELHLTSLAVHPKYRRQGLAKLILTSLFDKARHSGACLATLEVSSKNLAAIYLYKDLGFKTRGMRPCYYKGGDHALIQWLKLN